MSRLMLAAAIAVVSLAGTNGADATFFDFRPDAAALAGSASRPDAGASASVMQIHYRTYRYHRHRVYGRPPAYPGYAYGYAYRPYTDWTLQCMEDLGYGRRGMYGCGGR